MGKVKKQSGYLDNRGKFHKTIFACNNSNMWIRVNDLREKMNRLVEFYTTVLESNFKEDSKKSDITSPRHTVQNLFRRILVNEADSLVTFNEKRKEIENEIYKLQDTASKSKALRSDWWLGKKLEIERIYED